MVNQVQNRFETLTAWLWLGPVIAVGLYAGRIVSEWLRPGLIGALFLTTVTVAVSAYALRQRNFWRTWPLMLLLAYVLLPEPDPRMAIGAGLAASFGMLLAVDYSRYFPHVEDQAVDLIVGLSIGAGFFLLYANTLAPDLLPADSGELQLVAARLGVAHPPGFPLYTMLANLFVRLPIGPNEAYRANLFSAFTSALTVVLVYASVVRLGRSRLAGLLAAAALGTSATFWSLATTANVRCLTALFTAALIHLLLILRDRQYGGEQDLDEDSKSGDGPQGHLLSWLPPLFLFVLVLAVTHHSSLLFIGGLFGFYALKVHPEFITRPRQWPVLLLAAVIALLPLLYLPLRGAAGAIGAPDDLTTLSGFLNHVLGLGFRGDLFYFDEPTFLWARLGVMMNVLTFQFSAFTLLLMVLGLFVLFKNDRLFGVVVAASIVVHTLVAAVYRAPQTVEYMMPVYVLLAFLLGLAGSYLQLYSVPVAEETRWRRLRSVAATLLLVAMMLSVISQATQNYRSYQWLSEDKTARDYAQPLLESALPGSLILADWHWATPLWYLQEVEGFRPDVETVFVFPGAEPYAQTWARLIQKETASGRPVIATHYDPDAYADLPLAEPFQEAFLFSPEPRKALPEGYVPMEVALGPDLTAIGYKLASGSVEAGQELIVNLAWQDDGDLDRATTLFAHLIGRDGKLYAGEDQPARPQEDGLTISQFRLTPLLGTPPGQYDLVLGSYGAGEPAEENWTSLPQVTVEPISTPPFTRNRTYRTLADDADRRRLIGYDWDSTVPDRSRLYLHWSTEAGYETSSLDIQSGQYEMPGWYGPWGVERSDSSLAVDRSSSYVPFGQGLIWLGETVTGDTTVSPEQRVALPLEFTTSRPVLRDMVVSVRLVGFQEGSSNWDWWDLDDGVPAMGAIPTLKWIAGSRVHDPVRSTVSSDAWEGQAVEPLVLLYDAFTSRRLPLLDERFREAGPWLPMGKTVVEP